MMAVTARHTNFTFPQLDRYKLRNRLRHDNTQDEVDDDVHYMDDEEQEKLIEDIRSEDIRKNQFFTKAFRLVGLCSLPMFVVRFYDHPTYLDLLSITSIAISLLSIPRAEETKLQLKAPPRWLAGAARLNFALCFTIAFLTGYAHYYGSDYGGNPPLWLDDLEHLGFVPLGKSPESSFWWLVRPMLMCVCGGVAVREVVWVMSHLGRRFMEAVDVMALEELRYRYLGA